MASASPIHATQTGTVAVGVYECPCTPGKTYRSPRYIESVSHVRSKAHVLFVAEKEAAEKEQHSVALAAGTVCGCVPGVVFAREGHALTETHQASSAHRKYLAEIAASRDASIRAEEARAVAEETARQAAAAAVEEVEAHPGLYSALSMLKARLDDMESRVSGLEWARERGQESD